jgi:3-deoxy-D-manno-octulosonic-acid transferase
VLSLYSLVMWLLKPFVRHKLGRRAKLEPMYGERIEERFGSYEPFVRRSHRPVVWIHAVSLGESRAAAILLKELRVVMPTLQLLLTNGTATGRAEGEKLLKTGDVQVWQPWDTRHVTKQFFSHFNPTLGIVMETEIWPNLMASANAAKVPIVLANARMSNKTLRQTLRLKWLASPIYRGLTKVYAQTAEDANRLTRVGANVDGVFGNLKFDVTPRADQLAAAKQMRVGLRKPVILFASSREGEELRWLSALQALSNQARTSAHWLIVPRHPQRFDEVADLIESAGFKVMRRTSSSFAEIGFDFQSQSDRVILLGDTLGEMASYSALARAALLGGSFEKLGGQNLIEILACGCPVVMGPHTFNFEEASRLATIAGVAFRANDLESAIHKALQLCSQNEQLSQSAQNFVTEHRGAAKRTASAISKLCG